VGSYPLAVRTSKSSWNVSRIRCRARLTAGWLSKSRVAARDTFRSRPEQQTPQASSGRSDVAASHA
jgi:hypothetical protein